MNEPGPSPDQIVERARALSSFAEHAAERHAAWLDGYKPGLLQPPDFGVWSREVRHQAEDAASINELKAALRTARTRLQLHLVCRHISRLSACDETVASASALADLLIDVAVGWVEKHLSLDPRFGVPQGAESGRRQQLVVLALGKLGARELNLSSDVDLVLAYPEPGETTAGKTNQQYFVRAAQMLIDALDPVTVDGFVFRVDLRLRPYGDSGPLVVHFDAMERYFETQGRDWERYALLKARACAGDIDSGGELLERLRPFVFRRYLDFGAIEAMRDMKARIVAEHRDDQDVKLGPGGIRDLEFAVQVQQLVWGGRQPDMQEPNWLAVLPLLGEAGHIDAAEIPALASSYRFLRDVEHSIQALADEQTQTLPTTDVELGHVASMMGFADVGGFSAALLDARTVAKRFFDDAVAPIEQVDEARDWFDHDIETLEALGLKQAEACAGLLSNLRVARDRKSVAAEGRERLDRLMPLLLEDLRGRDDPGVVLARLVPILRNVLRRSAYLVLLTENPGARATLINLLSKSRWLAEEVREQPMQLDALLDDREAVALPDKAALAQELSELLARFDDGEEEAAMDALRAFRRQHAFAVALAELRGQLPLMKVSDYYTYLAEVLLEAALEIAWRACEGPNQRPLVVVGYGKLGGLELGPASDLDLVFIHGFEDERSQFLHRFARRLLHTLTARTYSGTLYEIDMRLRPSGNAGTMITSLEAFMSYQENSAWTWEQQALVRARAVAGDAQLSRRFEESRQAFLVRERDRAALREAVLGMRARLAQHHGDDEDLKQGSGGIVDIEFVVQYLVLAHAHEHPELARYSDNVRILEAAGGHGVLPEATTAALTDAYLALRAEAHRLALDLPNPDRAKAVLAQHRETVRSAWNAVFEQGGDV